MFLKTTDYREAKPSLEAATARPRGLDTNRASAGAWIRLHHLILVVHSPGSRAPLIT